MFNIYILALQYRHYDYMGAKGAVVESYVNVKLLNKT